MRTSTLALLCVGLAVSFAQDLQVQGFTSGNLFVASVYKQLARSSKDNFLFSPFSAQVVLALVQSGARDETATELRTRLHFPNSKVKTETAISGLLSTLKQNQYYTLHTANKIYVKNNFQIQDSFRNVANSVYRADVEGIDFSRTNQAATTMNQWVERNTNNKIQHLINAQSLNERTRAILINALYFQGNWSCPFKPHLTRRLNFNRAVNDVIKVDTMMVQSDFNYYENAELGARFLELPFDGGDVSMVIVLPDTIDGLDRLEDRIEKVFWPQSFSLETVMVDLPRFKIQTLIDFKNILKNLGVRRIFNKDQADLSGIAGRKGDLIINKVIQKTFIDVNEEGVEAAAATYADAVVPLSGYFPVVPPKEFKVDRPFIFYIKLKDLVLFAGKIVSPNY